MNCQNFEDVIRDLAGAEACDRSGGPLPRAVDHEQALIHARVHLDECEACALRLQDEQMLNRKLVVLAAEMKSVPPPARIEQELLHAFRQAVSPAAVMPAGSSRLSARAVGSRTYALAAAVVVILLGFGIVGLRSIQRSRQPAPLPAQAAFAQTNEAPPPTRTSMPDADSQPIVRDSPKPVSPSPDSARNRNELAIRAVRSIRQKPARRPAVNADASLAAADTKPTTTEDQSQTEVTTQFIALSYVGPASLQDGGQIVRVELPRSAMASFGLPVNMDRLSEKVRADVFVSADGFARAIRFVQ